MIFIAGISIALFISALLLVKKDKSKSDVYLLLWMLLNVAHLSFYYLNYSGTLYDYPHLLGIQLPFPLLQGVLLYFYVASVTNQEPKQKWMTFAHFLPPLLAYCYMISFFIRPAAEKIEIFKLQGGEEYAGFMMVLQICVFLSGIIYVVWCSYLLYKHKKNIRSQFSDIEEISLSWLQFLVYGLGVVWCLVIITQQDHIIYQAVAVFVILVGFFGVQQKNIFKNEPIQNHSITTTDKQPTITESPKEKYQSSGLSNQHAESHFKRLNDLMEEEDLYKNSTLSLSELAKEMDLHPNYLSQIINDKGGQSFYDYVNTFRVNEFKNLIAQSKNEQFTLMALAYECGFNSKSSFNRYFKKITGVTPSQFAKQ